MKKKKILFYRKNICKLFFIFFFIFFYITRFFFFFLQIKRIEKYLGGLNEFSFNWRAQTGHWIGERDSIPFVSVH